LEAAGIPVEIVPAHPKTGALVGSVGNDCRNPRSEVCDWPATRKLLIGGLAYRLARGGFPGSAVCRRQL